MTVIRRLLAIGLFVVLLVGGWSFAHGNPQTVPIDYLLGKTEPLAVWKIVCASLFAGIGLAALYFGLALLKDRVEIRRLQRAIRKLEEELRDFRNKPIEADLAQLSRLHEDAPTVADGTTGLGR